MDRSKSTKARTMFSTDDCMKKLASSLVEDFSTVMGPDYKREWLELLDSNIATFRSYSFPDRFQAPPRIFKMEAQLENLFKRYRFKADLYTDRALKDLSFAKFRDLQVRLATHEWKPIKHRAFIVVQKARKEIKDILKNFDPSTLGEHCRFSTRATWGHPAGDAYLDHKLADPFTGSQEHLGWFKSHLSENLYLFLTALQCKDDKSVPWSLKCESLQLIGVPKSYKSLRLIMPNTLVGSYYTYGLGKVFTYALREVGLDIRYLQSRHRNLARRASENRKLVTADMSAASESFLWSLMCRLLPRKWLRAVRLGRLSHYTVGDKPEPYYYCSFMAMGIGYTFPLQTLCFYALVTSVCKLLNVNGLVSVYGDDLIYPYKAHQAVTTILTDLGMAVNLDKTFVDVDFRESCGGDYYHGVDVRPFSPEGSCQQLSGKRYEAWLYQMINGLTQRWQRESITSTIAMLEAEVLKVARKVKQVPMSYPDTSGVRTAQPIFSPIHSPVLCRLTELRPFTGKTQKGFVGSREYVFEHLTKVSKQRFVSFEQAYLYDWLRAKNAGETDEDFDDVFEAKSFDSWLKYERFRRDKKANKWFSEGRPSLRLFPLPAQPKNYRSKSGKRLKRCIATSSCKLIPEKIQTISSDSISDWI